MVGVCAKYIVSGRTRQVLRGKGPVTLSYVPSVLTDKKKTPHRLNTVRP